MHRVNPNFFNNELNLNVNVYINTSWIVFSGNPDYKIDYDISPEALRKQNERAPGFIRLLDEDQELKLIEELKLEEEKKRDLTETSDEKHTPSKI